MRYEDGDTYDRQSSGPYYDLWFEMIEHYLEKYLPLKGEMLDAGGGTGEFSIRVAKFRPGLEITNLDISRPMLDTAKRKINELGLQSQISIRNGDMHNIPFPDTSFSCVICLGDALSFCSDFDKAFSELVRVTEPGGFIHLSVNSFWGNFYEMLARGHEQGVTSEDMAAYQETRILQIAGESTCCRSFSMDELRVLAEKNNLGIEKVFASPVLPVPRNWLSDPVKTETLKKLQYKHCEDENILELGNHLNVLFIKT